MTIETTESDIDPSRFINSLLNTYYNNIDVIDEYRLDQKIKRMIL